MERESKFSSGSESDPIDHVQIALPPVPDSATPSIVPTLYTDWLVLLRDKELGWRVISKIFSAASLHDPFPGPSLIPTNFAEVAGTVWDGYRALNREQQIEGLMHVLHESAQMSRSEQGIVWLQSRDEFLWSVKQRWQEPEKRPFVHLKVSPP